MTNRRKFLSTIGGTGVISALVAATQLVGSFGTINDIMPLVEFLALLQSRWVNGQTIFTDGGYVAR